MNIFYLDRNPRQAAQWHNDKHCIKMILETAQLLSSAHWASRDIELCQVDYSVRNIYGKTHFNHPSAVWTRKSINNYKWLCELGLELCKEYTSRYGKYHRTEVTLKWLQLNIPPLPECPFTDPPQAMPDEVKKPDTVEAYRNYYNKCKQHLAVWQKNKPGWYE